MGGGGGGEVRRRKGGQGNEKGSKSESVRPPLTVVWMPPLCPLSSPSPLSFFLICSLCHSSISSSFSFMLYKPPPPPPIFKPQWIVFTGSSSAVSSCCNTLSDAHIFVLSPSPPLTLSGLELQSTGQWKITKHLISFLSESFPTLFFSFALHPTLENRKRFSWIFRNVPVSISTPIYIGHVLACVSLTLYACKCNLKRIVTLQVSFLPFYVHNYGDCVIVGL